MSTDPTGSLLSLAELAASAVPEAAPLVAGFELVRKLLALGATAVQIQRIDPRKALRLDAADLELEARAAAHDAQPTPPADTIPPTDPAPRAVAPLDSLHGASGTDSPLAERLILACHFTPRRERKLLWVFLHSMESAAVKPRGVEAMACADWFHVPFRVLNGKRYDAPEASAHYALDPKHLIQMVREADEAWAAPGPSNAFGLHIEIAGKAMATDWQAETDMLERLADLLADISRRTRIPLVAVGTTGLLEGSGGVALHSEATDAVHKAHALVRGAPQPAMVNEWAKIERWRATHQDPGGPGGLRFPLVHVLDLARARM